MTAPGFDGKPKIFDDTQIHEQIIALERAGNSGPADAMRRPAGDVGFVEKYATGAWRQLAADLIDQAGLAGTVGPDDDMALAGLDGQVDAIGHDETAERPAQLIGAQYAHATGFRTRTCRNVPQIPPGKNRTQAMKTMPMIRSQCSL